MRIKLFVKLLLFATLFVAAPAIKTASAQYAQKPISDINRSHVTVGETNYVNILNNRGNRPIISGLSKLPVQDVDHMHINVGDINRSTGIDSVNINSTHINVGDINRPISRQ